MNLNYHKNIFLNNYVIQRVLLNDIEMILLWIVPIKGRNTGRKILNQILR